MTATRKFICACNITLSSRTSSFREKRERVNLPYTENRDMVKYWFLGFKIWLDIKHLNVIAGMVVFRCVCDYTRYIGSINLVKEPIEGLSMRHIVLSRAVARSIFKLFWIYFADGGIQIPQYIFWHFEKCLNEASSSIRALDTATTSCHNSMNPSFLTLECAIWVHSLVRTPYSYCYYTQNRAISVLRDRTLHSTGTETTLWTYSPTKTNYSHSYHILIPYIWSHSPTKAPHKHIIVTVTTLLSLWTPYLSL